MTPYVLPITVTKTTFWNAYALILEGRVFYGKPPSATSLYRWRQLTVIIRVIL